MHGVFWGGNPQIWGLDLENETDADMFKQFIRAWAAHLDAAGISPEEFCFYPLDEETSERMILIARRIKEANPTFQVYWNDHNQPAVDPEQIRRLVPYADIACVNLFSQVTPTSPQEVAFNEARRQNPLKVWTYACKGPGRMLAPDTYYRNLAWETFRRGATGTGFWTYADGGKWDAYEGRMQYGVVYFADKAPEGITRAERIIPSRRWEAFREGAEDFEYLARLQSVIAAGRKAGGATAACDTAEKLLVDAVEAVLNNTDDPERYDRARREITRSIIELQSATQ
jgi:hypothetical protein